MIIDQNELNKLYLCKGQQVQTKIEDISECSISDYESDNYRIIQKLTQKVDNKYYYLCIIQCKKCGTLKKIYFSDWKNQKVRKCIKCLSQTKRNLHVGYKNRTYTVLEIDVERSNKNRRRVYYKCKCNNCGRILSLRWDAIEKDTVQGKCCKCIGNAKVPTMESLYNIFYGRYQQNAISRNFPFELTKEEFKDLVSKNCAYCGSEPIEIQSLKRYNKTGNSIFMNGIDRIDSNQGYSLDNCVPCCEMCNRMKLNYSYDDFFNHISKIYNYHKSLTTISKESTSQANGDGSGGLPIKEDDIV